MVSKMKSFVLMNKKTGDLFEGHRISLLDKHWNDSSRLTNVFIVSYDGWAIYHPEMHFSPIYFNLECEKWFENLGEL